MTPEQLLPYAVIGVLALCGIGWKVYPFFFGSDLSKGEGGVRVGFLLLAIGAIGASGLGYTLANMDEPELWLGAVVTSTLALFASVGVGGIIMFLSMMD